MKTWQDNNLLYLFEQAKEREKDAVNGIKNEWNGKDKKSRLTFLSFFDLIVVCIHIAMFNVPSITGGLNNNITIKCICKDNKLMKIKILWNYFRIFYFKVVSQFWVIRWLKFID